MTHTPITAPLSWLHLRRTGGPLRRMTHPHPLLIKERPPPPSGVGGDGTMRERSVERERRGGEGAAPPQAATVAAVVTRLFGDRGGDGGFRSPTG
ncbi:hypothetical protein Hdeb2414_s0007g00242641 [Helianthus debilis subsp. tardiflorus]